ncbi:MAG: hypothetical protein R3C49_13545 [Planctomycetaceae bacterium]
MYFKSGDFGCYDLQGNLKWQLNVFERFAEVTSETLWWDLGTSPVLTSNAVVVTMMHSGPSYLAALNRTDGKLLWKHDRVTDVRREAAQSYTTPIVTTNPDGKEVKHTSLLNQIEIVFGIVSRRVMRRRNFKSPADLKDRLLDFVQYFNRTFARPFQWKHIGRPVRSDTIKRPPTWKENRANLRKARRNAHLVA